MKQMQNHDDGEETNFGHYCSRATLIITQNCILDRNTNSK